jgi:NAD(P)-dependent dehydrogenase (short-subunit alcohol dehydrogenase family)
MNRLDGKVCVVTGAAQGIGRAAAISMAEAGGRVLVTDIDGSAADAVAAEIVALGGDALATKADVSVEEEVEQMIEIAVSAWGQLNVLDNNAAATEPSNIGRDSGIVDADLDVWRRTLDVNLLGTLLGCKHAVRAMADHGGSIINMSSPASEAGAIRNVAYGASKAGVNLLTRHVATTYGYQGIRCNALCPGLTLTEGGLRAVPLDVRARFEDHTPLERSASPTEIAQSVLFLASDDASYITGQIIYVDGGMYAHAPHHADTIRDLRQGGQRSRPT